jgi:serine/threonine protein kinase
VIKLSPSGLSHYFQSNVLIDDSGEARLADFGLSRTLQTSAETLRNMASTTAWDDLNPATADSWRWKAPEQMEAVTALSCAADVWGFAMTVMEVRLPI